MVLRPSNLAAVLALAACGRGQRLRITNGCDAEPMWIAHMASSGTGPDEQNVRLAPGETFAFRTDPGLSGTRYWPKLRCDADGNGCLLGESGGPGESCDLGIGCAPPVDTKFEASFGADGSPDWVDVSLVDGWTLPFRFEMSERCTAGEGSRGVGTAVDCSRLSFGSCPGREDVGNASAEPLSLEVKHPTTGGVVGCYSPCAKLTFSNWGNKAATYAPADPEVKDYCCPTPPESPGQCRRGPVSGTEFVEAVHDHCPGVYGYAYDDGMGLILCPPNTTYDMTFYCPPDLERAFPKTPNGTTTSAAPVTRTQSAAKKAHEGGEEQQQRQPPPTLPPLPPLPPPPPLPPLPRPQPQPQPQPQKPEEGEAEARPQPQPQPQPQKPEEGEEEACPGAAYALAAARVHVSGWESFKISHHRHLFQDYVAMRTFHGRYVAAEPDGFVTATSHAVSYWELFQMKVHGGNRVSFRSISGKYLTAERYGSVRADASSVGAAELFHWVVNPDGTVALKASSDHYLSAIRTCRGDELESCFEKDTAYLPLDMVGEVMTREAMPALCQSRCAATDGCRSFTFYPQGGLCHLQAEGAARALSLGSTAGAPHCRVLAAVRKDLLPSTGLRLPRQRFVPSVASAALAAAAVAGAAALAALALRRAPRARRGAAVDMDSVELLAPSAAL